MCCGCWIGFYTRRYNRRSSRECLDCEGNSRDTDNSPCHRLPVGGEYANGDNKRERNERRDDGKQWGSDCLPDNVNMQDLCRFVAPVIHSPLLLLRLELCTVVKIHNALI